MTINSTSTAAEAAIRSRLFFRLLASAAFLLRLCGLLPFVRLRAGSPVLIDSGLADFTGFADFADLAAVSGLACFEVLDAASGLSVFTVPDAVFGLAALEVPDALFTLEFLSAPDAVFCLAAFEVPEALSGLAFLSAPGPLSWLEVLACLAALSGLSVCDVFKLLSDAAPAEAAEASLPLALFTSLIRSAQALEDAFSAVFPVFSVEAVSGVSTASLVLSEGISSFIINPPEQALPERMSVCCQPGVSSSQLFHRLPCRIPSGNSPELSLSCPVSHTCRPLQECELLHYP